jgi:hypothetical protein
MSQKKNFTMTQSLTLTLYRARVVKDFDIEYSKDTTRRVEYPCAVNSMLDSEVILGGVI